jgi:translation initiation factor 1A
LQGDIVLLSIRDFEVDKADLLQKYTSQEARELQKRGWLSEIGMFC